MLAHLRTVPHQYDFRCNVQYCRINFLLYLLSSLDSVQNPKSAEEIQTIVFEVGKRHNFDNLKDWFACLYRNLFGQENGPRMGSFIALYGIRETKDLINESLNR